MHVLLLFEKESKEPRKYLIRIKKSAFFSLRQTLARPQEDFDQLKYKISASVEYDGTALVTLKRH